MIFDVSGFSPAISGRGFVIEISNNSRYPIWYSIAKISGGLCVSLNEDPNFSEEEREELR